MKATDLMIGDWVMRGNIASEPMKVTEIIPYKDYVCMDFTGLAVAAKFSQINPIPLTPEILEQNGFEKRNRYQWEYRDGYCKIVISIAPKIKIKGELLGPPPIDVEIEGALFALNKTDDWYVHELQHALKLCGIEKEITL